MPEAAVATVHSAQLSCISAACKAYIPFVARGRPFHRFSIQNTDAADRRQ